MVITILETCGIIIICADYSCKKRNEVTQITDKTISFIAERKHYTIPVNEILYVPMKKQDAQFTMNNTNIPTDLKLSFVSGNEGKFANLYKSVDGKLAFVTCAKIGADGSAVLADIAAKGDYVTFPRRLE